MASTLRLDVVLGMLDKASGPLKKLRGNASGTGKGLDALKANLKALENHKKLSANFLQLGDRLSQAKERMAGMTGTSKAAQAQLEKQQVTVQKMTAAWAKAGAQLRSSRDALQLNGQGQQTLKQRIDSTTAAIEKQANAQSRLDRYKQQHGFAMMRGGMITGAGVASVYAGRRTFEGTRNILMPGMSFDKEMSRTQALARLEKDSPEMAAIRKQARDLGASTMFSATEVAQGQSFLAMAGFKPEAITSAMPGLLDLSKAGDTELGRTADIASNILSGFEIDPKQMGMVSDVLTMATTTANVNLEMLGNTMSYVGPVAQTLGMDLQTASAMAGLLGNAGIQSEKAGTALRAMMLRLSAPTGAAAGAIKELGLNLSDDKGNMRNIVDILADTAKAVDGMGNMEQMRILKEIFGEEPASGMATLLKRGGSGEIAKYLEVIRQSEGAARKTAGIMADNLTGDWDQIKSAWEDIGIGLFEANKEEFRAWAQTIVKGINIIGRWFDEHPNVSKWLVRAALALSAVSIAMGSVLVPLGILYAKGFLLRWLIVRMGVSLVGTAGRVAILAGWLTKAWPAVLALGKGFASLLMRLTPLGWAFTLLSIAGSMLYEKWDEVVAGGKMLWADLANFLTTVFDGAINYLTVTLPEKFKNIGAEMINGLKAGFTERWQRVKDELSMMADVDIIGYWKDKFGIRSPSRLFIGLGGHMTDGLAIGLERGAQAVRTATAGLAAAGTVSIGTAGFATAGTVNMVSATPMLPPMAAQSAAPQATSNTYQITINAAPGMDAQAIAVAVRTELDRRERKKSSRVLSQFHDTE